MTDYVRIRNTVTGEKGKIRRRLFENPAFNPNGLLVEDDSESGCVGCGHSAADAAVIEPVGLPEMPGIPSIQAAGFSPVETNKEEAK